MTIVNYDWDELEDNIDEEHDGTGTTIVDYTSEPSLYGNMVSQNRSGEVTFFHFDAMGSTTEVTTSDGNVSDLRRYTAFGDVSESSGTTTVPLCYIGQGGYYWDSSLKRYFIRRRIYDESTGVWMSKDPLAEGLRPFERGTRSLRIMDSAPWTLHILAMMRSSPYCYADNSPTHWTDVSGLVCCQPWIGWTTGCFTLPIPTTPGIHPGDDCPDNTIPATWDIACDPRNACGKVDAPPQSPPQSPPTTSPPGPAQPCNYPNRRVCYYWSGQCWESQCVCQCVGNSPHLNCMRGCIRCSHDHGAPINIDAETMCENACGPLTPNEQARLNCCLNNDFNHGGCSAAWYQFPPPRNPNPSNTTCTSMPIP